MVRSILNDIPEDGPLWMKLLAKFGLGALMTVGLVWFLTTVVSAKLDAALTKQEEVIKALAAHQMESKFYMRQICINTAKDDTDRVACLPKDEQR